VFKKRTDGFKIKAAYVGGHPEATRPDEGELQFEGDTLRWAPRGPSELARLVERNVRRGWAKEAEPFEINVARITSVEFQGDETFKLGPSGYVRLPVVLHGYGGSQPRHPLGEGKLTKALTVRYEDDEGREHEVVWVNTSDDFTFTGPLAMKTSDKGGHEIANIIRASANAARAPRTNSVPEI